MKYIGADLASFLRGQARRNFNLLAGYFVFLVALILLYAILFDVFMWVFEGRHFSFISGIYWTITAMTTLGFGDITFTSDAGRAFSALVTVSGVIFLLVLMPFALVSLFLAPWIENRLRYRRATQIPETTSGHVIVVGWDDVTATLVSGLRARRTGYVLLTADYDEMLRLEEAGHTVAYGVPFDSEVLDRVGSCRAQAIVANMTDEDNVNLILSARSVCPNTPVVAVLNDPAKEKFLKLAGGRQVIPLRQLLGRNLAVRSTTKGAFAHVVDAIGEMLVAEMPVHGTSLVGKTLGEARLRQTTGVSVLATWERGTFEPAKHATVIDDDTVLLFVGTEEQLKALEEIAGENVADEMVLILGYGTVGRAAAEFLEQNAIAYRVVEEDPPPACPHPTVTGDAAETEVLRQAGIEEAKGIIVTTNNDSTNVFLTLVCRHLSPDARIVSRANRTESVTELYTAGADFVVSLASLGANLMLNALAGKDTVYLTEGLSVFRRPVPEGLRGRTLSESEIGGKTGATVVATEANGEIHPISGDTVLDPHMWLVLVGNEQAELRFSDLEAR